MEALRVSLYGALLFPMLAFCGADIGSDVAANGDDVEIVQLSASPDRRVRLLENYLNAMQLPVSRARGEGLLAVLRDDPAATAPLHLIRECVKSQDDARFFAAELAKLAEEHPEAPELTLAAVQIGDSGELDPEVGNALLLAALEATDDYNTLPPNVRELHGLLLAEYATRLPLAENDRLDGERWFDRQLAEKDSPWRDRVLAAAAEYYMHEMLLFREGASERFEKLMSELIRREAAIKSDLERGRRTELYRRLGRTKDALRLIQTKDVSYYSIDELSENIMVAIEAEEWVLAGEWIEYLRKNASDWAVPLANVLETQLALTQKDYDRAAQCLKTLPDWPRNNMTRILYHLQRKEYEKALKVAREVEAAAGDMESREIASYGMLMVAERQRNAALLDEVVRKLERTAGLYDPEFANSVAYIDAELDHNLERSAELIERALAADPGNAAYMDTMAWLQFRLGNLAEAEKWILRALGTMTPSAELSVLYDHAGEIYSALGQPEKALRCYREALRYKPEEPEAIQWKIAALEGNAAEEEEK